MDSVMFKKKEYRIKHRIIKCYAKKTPYLVIYSCSLFRYRQSPKTIDK